MHTTIFRAALVTAIAPLLTWALTASSSRFLGNFTEDPNNESGRDLGFIGEVNNVVLATFGDVIQNGNFLAANAVGIVKNATSYEDSPNTATPQQFCKFFSDESSGDHGMGLTNIIQVGDTEGVLFFFDILRNLDVTNNSVYALGTGVATVTFDNGVPTCTRLSHYWWNAQEEPFYGDKSAVLSANGDYIYAIGACNNTQGGPCGGDWRFVNRVPTENATNFYAYEYWNGTAYNPTRIGPTEASAIRDTNGDILLQGNQGQIAWNNYLQKYIWLDALPYYDNNVRIRTADQPEGPWTLPSNLFEVTECNNFFYTPTYDNHWYTGDQTFVVHTTCDPNDIQSYEVVSATFPLLMLMLVANANLVDPSIVTHRCIRMR